MALPSGQAISMEPLEISFSGSAWKKRHTSAVSGRTGTASVSTSTPSPAAVTIS